MNPVIEQPVVDDASCVLLSGALKAILLPEHRAAT
jgi:hypothetical protein